jgi:hypothetical protein
MTEQGCGPCPPGRRVGRDSGTGQAKQGGTVSDRTRPVDTAPTLWEQDCQHWRGRVLTGKFCHWCFEWDGLPVDETTREWPCGCYPLDWDQDNIDGVITHNPSAARGPSWP